MALFVKTPVDWWDQPQIVQAGERAAVLLQRMQCHAQQHLTDGLVPAAMVAHFGLPGTPARLRALADGGLIEPADGGWQIVGFAEQFVTRAEVEAVREKRREAGAKGGRAKHAAKQSASKEPSNGQANGVPDLQISRSADNPAPPTPPPDDGPGPPDAELVLLADQTIQAAMQDPTALADAAQRLAVAEVLAAGHLPSAVLAAGTDAARGNRPAALLRAILKRLASETPAPAAPATPEACPNPQCSNGWVGAFGPDGRPADPERCPDCTGVRT